MTSNSATKSRSSSKRLFQLLWSIHRWTGVLLGVVFLTLAITGFLLIIKKDVAWIQPPTVVGQQGEPKDFIGLQQVFAAILAQQHEDFKSIADIDRIDFRPAKRVHKVRSKKNYSEIQVDAITGKVLSVATRRSSLIEDIHDGSFFADWVHDWVMLVASIAFGFLVCSGYYIWAWPIWMRRKRAMKRKSPAARAPEG